MMRGLALSLALALAGATAAAAATTAPAPPPAAATAAASEAAARREALARAATFEFDTGRPDRAAQLAADALAVEGAPAGASPPAAALRFLRSEALLAAGEVERAAAERDALLRSAPGTPWARAALDLCALEGAACAGSDQGFDVAGAIARGPLGLAAAIAAGVRLAETQGGRAVEAWGRPLESSEAAPFWLLVLARAHLAARDTAAAGAALERAVQGAARAGSDELVSEAALRRAALAYHQGRAEEALTWVQRVTDEKGRTLSCPGAIITGYAYHRLGRMSEAAQAFNYAQACARDKGERGRLLALEARCRALSGEARLAASVAGDAAQDLEAAARGEVGAERLEDATDVLPTPLELEVDRTRLARAFVFGRAVEERWLTSHGEAAAVRGFPFRVVRDVDGSGDDAPAPAGRVATLAALRAREAAEDRARNLGMLRADLAAMLDTLGREPDAPAEEAEALRRARATFDAVGTAGAALELARARADSARALVGARRARAAAVTGRASSARREDRTHALARAALEREAEARELLADSTAARARRRIPALSTDLAPALAAQAERALAARRTRRESLVARARALQAGTERDAMLDQLAAERDAAQLRATRAAEADSAAARARATAAEGRARERTALLRNRAEADYEVALFERSAWAAIALDEQDSTEADLRPAIAASDAFLARFPQSTYVPACLFNRADLEARRAVAAARARGRGVPDFAPAIARYEDLLAAHPRFRRLDAVLFNLSSLERARGNEAAADRRLEELIARAPSSELVPDAHVALGDRAFEAKDYAAAERHYAAIATSGGGAYAPMARYKQGYAAIQRGDAPTATDAFTALLALAGVDSSSAADGLIQLARAIRLGGGAPALERWLDGHATAPYGFELTRLVAVQEQEDGGFDRAARAWRVGYERFPTRPEAVDFAQNALAAWDLRARDDERVAIRLDLGRHFAPGAGGAPAGAKGAALGARSLLEGAFLVHERASAKKDRPGLERAVEIYRERARLYPAADSAALAATSEGEALFDLGRFAEAAVAHERAARALPATVAAHSAADTLRREAAFGAALARERVAAAAAYRTPAERDSLERAIDRLEVASPNDPRLSPLRLSLALGAREAADETRARRLFERMAGRDTSEASRRSQSELGRIALAEKSWLEAETYYAGAAAAYLAAGDRAEEARLTELAASARFKEAEELEARGDSAKAADQFRTLADRYPQFPQADVALYRAGLDHLAAGVPRRAEEHLATLRERYPNSALAGDALLRRAEAQIAAADTSGAALTYASAPLTTANFVAAHEEAARLWRGMGSYTEAEAAYRRIAREAPDGKARTRALADLATLLYQLGRKPEAFQATAPWRTNRFPEGMTPDPAADQSARFVAGRMLADSTLSLPVTHPIKPALDRKLAVLGPALDHLKAAATTTASPYWGESGYVAGLLLDDLGARVAVLPPPAKMSAEDSIGYRTALAAQATSFYARAEDLWIATLEGLSDLAAPAPARAHADSARRDSAAAVGRPRDGWAGRIWERLEPRLVVHYRWRMAADDLPALDPTVVPGTLGAGANGSTLVAGMEDAAVPVPAAGPRAPGDSLDAGAVEDLRNRMRWIAQYVADGQFEEAGRWADTALKSFPNRAEIWNDVAVVRHRLGDWGGADRAWAEALRLDPKHPAALYNRALFERFYRLDRVAARQAFERFLTLGAPFDEALADRMAEERK